MCQQLQIPIKPDEVFVGETLVDGAWIYLVTWQGKFSRKISGSDLAEKICSISILNALEKAIVGKNLEKGLIIHLDGGGGQQIRFRGLSKTIKKHKFA